MAQAYVKNKAALFSLKNFLVITTPHFWNSNWWPPPLSKWWKIVTVIKATFYLIWDAFYGHLRLDIVEHFRNFKEYQIQFWINISMKCDGNILLIELKIWNIFISSFEKCKIYHSCNRVIILQMFSGILTNGDSKIKNW